MINAKKENVRFYFSKREKCKTLDCFELYERNGEHKHSINRTNKVYMHFHSLLFIGIGIRKRINKRVSE